MLEVETRANEVATLNQNLEDTKSKVIENRELITEVQVDVDTNTNEIKSISSEINSISSEISVLKSDITTNARQIETLANQFEASLLRFHVEAKWDGTEWPADKVVTYEIEVVDTHNAMDIGSGIFTAPMAGVYGFFFYSRFSCQAIRHLYVYHNDLKIEIQVCYTDSFDDHVITSNSVYFAREMEVGDTIKIFSGSAIINMVQFRPKFTGFLLEEK